MLDMSAGGPAQSAQKAGYGRGGHRVPYVPEEKVYEYMYEELLTKPKFYEYVCRELPSNPKFSEYVFRELLTTFASTGVSARAGGTAARHRHRLKRARVGVPAASRKRTQQPHPTSQECPLLWSWLGQGRQR